MQKIIWKKIPESVKEGALIVADYLGKDMEKGVYVEIEGEQTDQGFAVEMNHGKAFISYENPSEFFRGVGIVKEWISMHSCWE